MQAIAPDHFARRELQLYIELKHTAERQAQNQNESCLWGLSSKASALADDSTAAPVEHHHRVNVVKSYSNQKAPIWRES